MADRMLEIVRGWEAKLELQYNKTRIRLAKDGMPDTFVTFRPKQQFLRVEARVERSDEIDGQLEQAGLDLMPYKAGKYRVRLTKSDLAQHESVIVELLRRAYEQRES